MPEAGPRPLPESARRRFRPDEQFGMPSKGPNEQSFRSHPRRVIRPRPILARRCAFLTGFVSALRVRPIPSLMTYDSGKSRNTSHLLGAGLGMFRTKV